MRGHMTQTRSHAQDHGGSMNDSLVQVLPKEQVKLAHNCKIKQGVKPPKFYYFLQVSECSSTSFLSFVDLFVIYQLCCQGVTFVSPSPPVGGTPCRSQTTVTMDQGILYFYHI